MPKRTRSPNAALRASFGRAERLRQERTDSRVAMLAAKQERPERRGKAARKDRTAGIERTAARQRKLTALDKVRQRVERAEAKAEQRRQQRLQTQTRAAFNKEDERRHAEQARDRQRVEAARKRTDDHRRRAANSATERKADQTRTAFNREADRRRAEQSRNRQQFEAARKKADDHRRSAARKSVDRKRDQVRAAFNKEADRRRDAARRLDHDRLRQRAAAEIEREQKRSVEVQKAEHHRQRAAARVKRDIARDSFRDNETAALERHHGRIGVINNREDRALADFDGRRKGLAGRAAELVPGRRAANEGKRAEMVRGFEAERVAQHRDLEALKTRQADQAQKARIDYFRELKEMQGRHRSERGELGRDQTDNRLRLIQDRARAMGIAEQVHEQQRQHARAEHVREKVRPSGDFGSAASDHAREPTAAPREFHRQEEREMVRPSPAFGRA